MDNTLAAIVFDLYGTLLQVPRITSFSFLKANISDEVISRDEWKALLLKRDYRDIDHLLETIQHSKALYQELVRQFKAKLQKELGSIRMYEGTQEVLGQLSEKYPLNLMSNLASCFKQPVYDLGLDVFFKQMFFSCEVGLAKPDIRFFRFVSKEIKLPTQRILMIGDSLTSDYQGANRAGMVSLHLNRGKRLNAQVNQITTLNDLFDYLENL